MKAALDLVDEARHDGSSLERLIAEVWPQAYRLAFSILHDRGLAEDAAQEACASIARALPALRVPATFPSWSYRIVVNRALSTARKRPSCQPLEAADSGAAVDPSGDLDMRAALAKLTVRQRAIVLLHYYAGFRSSEIAEAVGVPPTTVRFHLMTARRALQRALTEPQRRGVSQEVLPHAR